MKQYNKYRNKKMRNVQNKSKQAIRTKKSKYYL